MTEQFLEIPYENHSFSLAIRSRKAANSDTTVVFLHGIGCSKDYYDQAFEAEDLRNFSLLAFDFPGFGGSDKPEDFDYSLEAIATIAEALIQQLAPDKKIVLVAHSMGGTVGTLLAGRISNLVTFINVEGNFVSQDAGYVSRRTAEQTEQEFVEKGFNDFLAKLVSSDRKDLQIWAKMYEQSSPIAFYRAAKSLVEWSDSGKLMALFNALPHKAYIYGDQGGKDYLLAEFTNTQTYCIPDSEHFMMIDNPDGFYKAIAEALGSSS